MKDLLISAAEQNIDWPGIERAFSFFAESMSRTEQNPEFHGEGDVWTHTKMVCEGLVKLESFLALESPQRQAVFLAALLHDVGKIPTTRWEDGRWTSPNHSLVGSKMARQFLWQQLGLCGTPEKQQLRETVCNLIRYHSFPPHAIEDNSGKRKMMGVAANGRNCPMLTMELLCVLCEADASGRICRREEERSRMIEQVQLCREFARESGCSEGPFPFPSEHTQYAYLSGKQIVPEVELYDDTWGQVIMLSGLPGTGKDTWIREHYSHLPMISLDRIRKEYRISPTDTQTKVAQIAKEQAQELLRRKQPFVFNATNLSPQVRGKQLGLFTQYHASTKIIFLETDWEEQLRRNGNRPDMVPEYAICHMMRDLVLPEAKEAYQVEWKCV